MKPVYNHGNGVIAILSYYCKYMNYLINYSTQSVDTKAGYANFEKQARVGHEIAGSL